MNTFVRLYGKPVSETLRKTQKQNEKTMFFLGFCLFHTYYREREKHPQGVQNGEWCLFLSIRVNRDAALLPARRQSLPRAGSLPASDTASAARRTAPCSGEGSIPARHSALRAVHPADTAVQKILPVPARHCVKTHVRAQLPIPIAAARHNACCPRCRRRPNTPLQMLRSPDSAGFPFPQSASSHANSKFSSPFMRNCGASVHAASITETGQALVRFKVQMKIIYQ